MASLRCQQCRCENLADASFCQECGTRLELICPGCETANAPTSKFCRRCGTRLAAGPETRPAALTAAAPAVAPLDGRGGAGDDDRAGTTASASNGASAPQDFVPQHLAERFRQAHATHLLQHAGERKIITALFADIKGSMALLDEMDPEQARQVIDPALRLMMNAVYRYEGYVAQALGDGIFALFGAPIAREDHARRALYAALSMQEEMKAYGVQLLRDHGLPALQIRVGINTGEVVVRAIATGEQRADYVPIGHSTGLAARIENVAAPGTVVVSDSTHRLTQGFFEFRALGSVPMKGVSANVALFEVTGIGALRTRLEVSAMHGLARFVGRRSELERMQAMLELAKAGQGQIVGVIGEAGVGKSRLCHEFKLIARGECRVLECASDSYGRAFPYLPLIDLLKNYLEIAPGDEARVVLEKVTGRVLALDRALDDTIPFLLALLGVADPNMPINRMDPQIRRRRTFQAVQRLILREARNQPVLMVIEDLHWLDDETQSFLSQFGRTVGEARILLLVNYRPEYHAVWDTSTSHTQLRLNAFGTEDAQALLVALLGNDTALEPLKRLIVEKTQGNPFFIEEYVRTLFDHDVLVRREQQVVLTRALSEIEMPATVQGMLAARIDRLPAETKAYLQLLAVLGAASPLRLIERLVVQDKAAQLQELLGQLQSAEFIYERPAFPDVEYVFKHALTRETAYGELVADSRRSLHARVAQAIEAHYQDSLEEHCSELAHHYASSDNLPKAVDFLQRAGAQATQRSAYTAAIGHLTAALAMLPKLPDPRARDEREIQLQSMLGSAWMATRGFAVPEVAHAYRRARELCHEGTTSLDFNRVLAGLGLFNINRSELAQARDAGEQLLGLAERRQDQQLAVSGHEVLGLTLLRVGEFAACDSHFTQAVDLYDEHRDAPLRDILGGDPVATCVGFDALALWMLGRPDQALAGAAQAVRAAHAAKPRHPFSLAYALLSSVWVRQFRREATLALQEAAAATEFATEHGFPTWLAHSLLIQGWAEVELGQTERGLARMVQAMHTYEGTGASVWMPFYRLLQSQGLACAGRDAEALDAATRGLGEAQAMGSYWWEAELHRQRGELLLRSGGERAVEARACIDSAVRIARVQGAKALELRACTSRLRHRLDVGAAAELARVCDCFSEGLDTADLREARELLPPRN